MEFTTRVCGIPCICRTSYYHPAVPGRTYGPPEFCYPDEDGEFEYELYNVNGKSRLKWLEKKMTERDETKLAEEHEAAVTAAKYDYDY